MTLSVEIQTLVASQVDKVVPKHRFSFTTRKIGNSEKGLLAEVLSKGPRGSTRAPTPAGDVDISLYVK